MKDAPRSRVVTPTTPLEKAIMYSPYQTSLRGLLCTIYGKCDAHILREKIEYLENLKHTLGTHANYSKILEQHKKNLEFICRQLNQQMLEGAVSVI